MATEAASPERPNAGFEVAILAKAPVAGYAKTRLIPLLGAQGAAELQRWLLLRTLATTCAAAVGPLALWCAPDCEHPDFVRCAERQRLALYRQPEGDLGARLLAAAGRSGGATVIVGTDCPALAPADIVEACAAIRGEREVAIIPAEDGGYVLIALRQPHPELFAAIDWGSSSVMVQTRERAGAAGLRLIELAPKWDLDRAEDFRRLLAVTGFSLQPP